MLLNQHKTTAIGLLTLVVFLSLDVPAKLEAAHLGMGLRVGEVTQTSAIVWTRVTKSAERNWDGYRDPMKREPQVDEYTPSPIAVDDREGAMPGAPGQVRVTYSTDELGQNGRMTDWMAVGSASDYVYQFQLVNLDPGTKYFLKVEVRENAGGDVTDSVTGSFTTANPKTKWQDVSFAVVTGQSYWDLDDKNGYHIYPAMAKQNIDFIVPTGDTVYLDSEAPRARTKALARYHWHRMYSLPRHIEFHQHIPGYWEVDDHDSWANDGWPTIHAPWLNPLTFEEGFAIYREQNPIGDELYRTIRWGKGLQIWLVEGRKYRSPNTMPDGPDKLIWGEEQREWLKRTILDSDADFRVLVSPTPIVGPDRDAGKNDNHSNEAFQTAGDHFRNWTRDQNLKNFYVCNGDRHWQYMSIDPATKLREFSCGPASDVHAGGNPEQEPEIQPFLRVKGGFLTVSVIQPQGVPTIAFRHHDVHGNVVHEFTATSK